MSKRDELFNPKVTPRPQPYFSLGDLVIIAAEYGRGRTSMSITNGRYHPTTDCLGDTGIIIDCVVSPIGAGTGPEYQYWYEVFCPSTRIWLTRNALVRWNVRDNKNLMEYRLYRLGHGF